MATEYNDLYIRDNFGDDGSTPSPGNPYASPDIIPYQSDVLTYDLACSSYDGPTDLGKPVIGAALNNIYTRAMNLGNTPTQGMVSVSYSPSNLFLLPTTWTPIATATGTSSSPLVDKNGAIIIDRGTMAINQSAFMLVNLPVLQNGAHYCLISVIQTPTHPVLIPPTFASNSEMVLWIQNNPAVGWRNIDVVPNKFRQLIVTHGFSSINAAYWAFECTGVGFEPGVTITIQCTDQRCPFSAEGALPSPDPTGAQKVIFEQYIPAAILDAAVVVTLTAATQPFTKGARLRVVPYQVPQKEIELDMVVASAFFVTPDYHRAADDGLATLIQLGECTTILGD